MGSVWVGPDWVPMGSLWVGPYGVSMGSLWGSHGAHRKALALAASLL